MIQPPMSTNGRWYRAPSSVLGPVAIPAPGANRAAVVQAIHHRLEDDIPPERNFGTYGRTSLDEDTAQLVRMGMTRNIVDRKEYAQIGEMDRSNIIRLAELLHAPGAHDPGVIGVSTAGSSEGVLIPMRLYRNTWYAQQQWNPHRSPKDRPYVILSRHSHHCLQKAAETLNVLVKWIEVTPPHYAMTAPEVKALLETRILDDPQVMQECGYKPHEVGQRTMRELVSHIGCTVGTTYTAACDDVAGIDQVLTAGGWDIAIHLDAAAAGFVFPFIEAADTVRWDFRLPHVRSINVSNHKYGWVPLGMGTVVFRDTTLLEGQSMSVIYLSGLSYDYNLNFSRPSVGVLCQYANFCQLDYRAMIQMCLAKAQYIARAFSERPTLQASFEVMSDTALLPVVVFRWKEALLPATPFALAALEDALRRKKWAVPAYPLSQPPQADGREAMRIVVRPDACPAVIAALLEDLETTVHELTRARHQRCQTDRQLAAEQRRVASMWRSAL